MAINTSSTVDALIARADDDVDPSAGFAIVEDISSITRGVQNGSWLESGLGLASTTADVVSLAVNPIATVASWGIAWLIEHVKPLTQVLESVTGNPAQAAAQAQTCRNVATSLAQCCDELGIARATDLTGWTGTARTAYRALSSEQFVGLAGLAEGVSGLATLIDLAAMAVGFVRDTIRDLISELLGQLVQLAISILVPATAVAAGAAAAVLIARCATRVAALIKRLLISLNRLRSIAAGLQALITQLTKRFRRTPQPPTPRRPRAQVAFNVKDGDANSAWYDALKRANDNPAFDHHNSRTGGNCAHCALAYELNRRPGYDVRATLMTSPWQRGRDSGQIARVFGRDPGEFRRYDMSSAREAIAAELTRAGPGSRGIVELKFYGQRSDHMFSVEHIGSEVRFVDAQSFNADASRYFDLGSDDEMAEALFLRTDQLPDPLAPPGWVELRPRGSGN